MNGNYMVIVSLLLTWTSANLAFPASDPANGVVADAVENQKGPNLSDTTLPPSPDTTTPSTTAPPTTAPPTTASPTTASPTTAPPDTTTTTTAPTTTKTTTESPTPPTTTTPKTTPTPTTPSTTSTSTTLSPNTTTTTVSPVTTTESPGHNCRRFDGPSFIGGIILTVGLSAIAFVAFKFYKARNERNYHTL